MVVDTVLMVVLMALLIEVETLVMVVVVATPGGAAADAKLTSPSPALGGDAASLEVTATA